MPQEPVKEILDLLTRHQDHVYPGEPITILEHSLRTAFLAEEAKAPSYEIAAALLHNLGYMLQTETEGTGEIASNRAPDDVVRSYLHRWFSDTVVEPILLHTAAKRYLCATDPEYTGQLSESSATSLAEAGGPMSPSETAAFLESPHAEAAIRLRRWHDQAKAVGSSAPELDHFVPHLDASTVEIDNLSASQII